MISSKIKAVRNLKNTVVLILFFSLSKIDECTCRVLWPSVWFFIKKSGLTQSWMGNLRPLKNLASDPFWSIALSNLLQPHSLCWRSLYSASRIPLGHQKRSKTFAQVNLTSFFMRLQPSAFRTKGNSRVCCWSVQHCTVKASNLERRPATRRRAAASSGGGAHWWLLSLKKVS